MSTNSRAGKEAFSSEYIYVLFLKIIFTPNLFWSLLLKPNFERTQSAKNAPSKIENGRRYSQPPL